MKTNPNEPIVPITLRQVGDNDFRPATQKEINEGIYLKQLSGLTKREYYAGIVMQGIVSGINSNPEVMKSIFKLSQESKNEPAEYVSQMAIEYTDALITELNKTEP